PRTPHAATRAATRRLAARRRSPSGFAAWRAAAAVNQEAASKPPCARLAAADLRGCCVLGRRNSARLLRLRASLPRLIRRSSAAHSGVLRQPLTPQAQVGYDLAVALQVRAFEVAEQPPALADHHQQPAARVVVLAVRAQVLGQVVDALGEQRNLDLGGAGIPILATELADQLLLLLLGQRHQGGVKLAQSSLAAWTSRCICAVSSLTPGNRRSPRSRLMNAIRSVRP